MPYRSALSFLLALPLAAAAADKPNLVFIMADDLGWADTSNPLTTAGDPSDYYQTPMLERLASEGVAFTNAYALQNCAPTRAALLTGLYAVRRENNVYQVGNLNRGGKKTMLVGPPQGCDPAGINDKIPAAAVTLAETLRGAGYRTGYFGKFHVTQSASAIVTEHGFTENFGGSTSGSPGNYLAQRGRYDTRIGPAINHFAMPYTQPYVDQNIKPFANGTSLTAIDALVGTEKHLTDATTDAALDFMERNAGGDPFLVFFSTHAVHSPIGDKQARPDLLAKYKALPPGDEDSNASFGALIEGLDQSVARLVRRLESTPDASNPGRTLADNTVLIFFSDNGGSQSQSNNGPLKGQKGELDEGGIRVPMIAWSANPTLVRGGRVIDTPVHCVDFHQTFAALAGVEPAPGAGRDGVDLSGLFADPDAELAARNLYWHLPGYLVDQRRQRPQSVVRSGDMKLLYNYEDHSWELYNLASDVGEANNLAATQPEVVAKLGAELMAWLDNANAPLAMLREGQPPLRLRVTGKSYADGEIRAHAGETMVINPGDEVPMMLGEVGVVSVSD
ncbi:MAG: sulfatase [Planctomycetota bacterium]